MTRAAGPFEILEILGEGSFGTVCVARVTGDPLRRKVALKILKGAYASNKKILNRTRDEARLLSRISHPNIVRVERLMDVGGRPVVVMEHVQGVSLDQLLLRFKEGLPASIAIEVVRQTCLALHVAYSETSTEDGRPMRVIHRDMKPSNVMLSVHGEVKVVDFGIAKGDFEGREAETESVVMGSRPYMAPERLDGVSDSPAVDVYSTGMSLFELISGRTMTLSINPVNHGQALERQLNYLKVPGLSEQGLGDLRGLVRRMCAYDRLTRPAAIDVARELEQVLFQLPSEQRVSLEEFARNTVVPIYESRPRITPDDAVMEDPREKDILKEVTGQLTGTPPKRAVQSALVWTPYVFVGALAVAVLVLGGLAVRKVVTAGERGGASAASIAAMGAGGAGGASGGIGEDGKVAVKVWFPADAQVQIGDQFLPQAASARLFPGLTLAQFYFDNGAVWNCTFLAEDGVAVRYVVEAGRGAVSVNDSPGRPCVEVAPPSRPAGIDAGRSAPGLPAATTPRSSAG